MASRLATRTILALAVGGLTAAALAQSDSAAPVSTLRRVPAETTAAAYVDKNWQSPRTSWGHPSFEGAWSTDDFRGVPMSRPRDQADRMQLTPEEFATRAQGDETGRDFTVNVGTFLRHEFGIRTFGYTSLIVDPPNGQMPALTPAAQAAANARTRSTFGAGPFDSFEDFSLYDRCITRGVLGSLLPVIYGNGLRITQNPESVAISYEMIHDTRIIPLDGRSALDDGIRQWMGSARGRFEGDTLVVETTNYHEAAAYGGASSALKTVERFTPTGPDTIEWSIRLDDPHTWTRPWSFGMRLTRDAQSQVFEYACHEGNEGMRGMLKAARDAEKRETK